MPTNEYMRQKIYCPICDKSVARRKVAAHKRTQQHIIKESFKDIINKIKFLKQ
jgi:uncharacterized Zn finger protein (UPF0148 family)